MKLSFKISLLYFLVILLTILGCDQEVSTTPPIIIPEARATVYIDSKPRGATIFINDDITGYITPDTVKWLDEGIYKLTLKLKYYKDTNATIVTSLDSIYKYFFDYTTNPTMRGKIFCDSKPEEATVYIDDSLTNILTPDELTEVLPGIHKIRYKKPGYWDAEKFVEVYTKQISYLFTELEDSTIWVSYTKDNSNIPSIVFFNGAVDNDNVKWFGTPGEGLIRYDDKNWIKYDDTNSPLSSNIITSIVVDEKNNKWIGTIEGLIKFDGVNWDVFNTLNSGIRDNFINCIAIDKKNTIWIGTMYNGIVSFDGASWRNYNVNNSPIPSNQINSIAVDQENVKWFGTTEGLVKFNAPSRIQIFRYDRLNLRGIPFNTIKRTTIDSNNRIWIANNNQVAYYYGSGWYKFDSRVDSISCIISDRLGNIFISSHLSGLYKVIGANLVRFLNTKLRSNNVTWIVEDKNGFLWLTTLGGGITKYKGG